MKLKTGGFHVEHRIVACLLLAGSAVVAPCGAVQAQAVTPAGTTAGTTITNTATASYSVGGTTNSVSSNPATFKVDRKVNLTVEVDQASTTPVTLSQQNAVTRFKVTNNTNDVQDFRLLAHQALDFPGGLLPGTDTFDLQAIKVVADDGDGIYDPIKDVLTYIDELAPDTSRVVYIVGNVAAGAPAGQSNVALEAIAAAGGAIGSEGAILLPTDLNILNQNNEIDIVFADSDNDTLLGPDAARNGRGWAYAGYSLALTALDVSVAKTATVLSDGLGSLNPKAIPGATVQYCLTVANGTLLSTAQDVRLIDVVPTGTTYVPGSISVGGLGLAGQCLLNGVPIADNGSTTGTYGGSYDVGSRTVTAIIGSLAGGTSVAASFRVTVN
jgi:uncharacterized repeat protein (TIGR01451 family)